MTRGEHQPDATRVAQDLGADLEQTHADRAGCGALEFGVNESDSAQPVHQRVGKRGQQQPELVGLEPVAARARTEQIDLRLLDAVLFSASPRAPYSWSYSAAGGASRLVTTKRGFTPCAPYSRRVMTRSTS